MSNMPFEVAQLMIRFLKQDLNEQELLNFEKILQENPEYKKILESFKEGERVQKELETLATFNVDTAWRKVKRKKQQTRLFKNLIGVAASLLLLLGFYYLGTDGGRVDIIPNEISRQDEKYDVAPARQQALLTLSSGEVLKLDGSSRQLYEHDGTVILGKEGSLNYSKGEQPLLASALLFNTLMVPAAGIFKVQLPDGTLVWLNALSELRFPVQFASNERRVELKGEAYFEVVRDPIRPFKVSVSDTEIEVLGTSFNIKDFDQHVATTLLEGAVNVMAQGQNIRLLPGQQASSYEEGIKVRQADVAKTLAWKNNLFHFNGETMQELMDEVSRWYDVEVFYKGKPSEDTYKGIIPRDVPLSTVLEMLHFISGNEFEISDKTVQVILIEHNTDALGTRN